MLLFTMFCLQQLLSFSHGSAYPCCRWSGSMILYRFWVLFQKMRCALFISDKEMCSVSFRQWILFCFFQTMRCALFGSTSQTRGTGDLIPQKSRRGWSLNTWEGRARAALLSTLGTDRKCRWSREPTKDAMVINTCLTPPTHTKVVVDYRFALKLKSTNFWHYFINTFRLLPLSLPMSFLAAKFLFMYVIMHVDL